MSNPANHRQNEHIRIRRLLKEIFESGLTRYKLALMVDRRYNTVLNWSSTGTVESGDAQLIEAIHRECCASGCAVTEQGGSGETLLNSRVIFGSMWEKGAIAPEPVQSEVGDEGIQRTNLGVGSGKQAISLDPSSSQYCETPKAAAFYIAK